jgi:hypothetical protein
MTKKTFTKISEWLKPVFANAAHGLKLPIWSVGLNDLKQKLKK